MKEYYVTSSDEKPTNGVTMGSALIEVDTGNFYLFNETAGEWVLQFCIQSSDGGSSV